jgi:hypothetical protein
MTKLIQFITKNWDDFLFRVYEEKAKEDLEVLVQDDKVMEKWSAGEQELPWQPYPVAPPATPKADKGTSQ